MNCLAMVRIAATAVLASGAVTVAGAPAAAATPVCGPRTATVSDAVRVEGRESSGRRVRFAVSTTGCSAATIQYRTTSAWLLWPTAAEGVDYAPTDGVLYWAAGDTTDRVISVPILGESDFETDEVFAVELFDPVGGRLADSDAVGTIVNDDILLSEPECRISAAACEVPVFAPVPAATDLTLHFATRDGTATAGADYVGVLAGTLTIPAGSTQARARIGIRADRVAADAEFFFVSIFVPSEGEITTVERRVTIPHA